MNGIRIGALGAFVLTTSFAPGAEIVPESRDSQLMVTFANLGFTEGYDGDGEPPIDFMENGLTSDDDMMSSDIMYYGPDSFGRINSGEFETYQDVTIEPGKLVFDFYAHSDVGGDASPLCTIDNDMFFTFHVDETTTATLNAVYLGDTNVGDSRVGLQLREVGPGSDPVILDDLFLLGGFPDGPNEVEVEVTLEAGKRYRFYVDSHTRALATNSAQTAEMVATLTLACDADLNGDGAADFFDISVLLMDEVDYNGDTSFDFFDISAFLQDLSVGCP